MTSDFIVNVTESDFEYQVLSYSQNVPVVVDFWADWCIPCRTLGPILERLAEEGQGSFRLAKVDVDENPNLAIRYAVRSIPIVKAFRHGKVIAEFIGVQPEPRVRDFVRAIAPSESDLQLEKAFSLLETGQVRQAEMTFQQILEKTSDNSKALLGLARSLVLQGHGQESYKILVNFPASREYQSAEVLLPLSKTLIDFEKGMGADSDNPLDAAFHNALRLVKNNRVEAAMDGLLDILREDKHYHSGLARQMMVAILEALGESNPITRQYRSELASVLF
jgi:putative thioredoxin